MKVKITLLTHGATANIIATYLQKRFKRLEIKSGKMNNAQYKALMMVVPRTVDKLEKFKTHYEGRVLYEIIEQKKKTLFTEMMEAYHSWYLERTEINPKIDGVAGRHLKQIIAYLRKQSTNDDEVKEVFQYLLNSWDVLDDFYREQKELRQINSNINIILKTVKHGTSDSKTQAKSVSNDFRQKF